MALGAVIEDLLFFYHFPTTREFDFRSPALSFLLFLALHYLIFCRDNEEALLAEKQGPGCGGLGIDQGIHGLPLVEFVPENNHVLLREPQAAARQEECAQGQSEDRLEPGPSEPSEKLLLLDKGRGEDPCAVLVDQSGQDADAIEEGAERYVCTHDEPETVHAPSAFGLSGSPFVGEALCSLDTSPLFLYALPRVDDVERHGIRDDGDGRPDQVLRGPNHEFRGLDRQLPPQLPERRRFLRFLFIDRFLRFAPRLHGCARHRRRCRRRRR
mmetsp:Transcript_15165/g.53228  ORF Transcript_15165/g.53228 Transcript_15165/m.53228 type:complete len:270 (-) Transcript_15165:1396-2205(-)